MRVSGKQEPTEAGGRAQAGSAADRKQKTFANVLDGKKDQAAEPETIKRRKVRGKEEPLLPGMEPREPAMAAALPFVQALRPMQAPPDAPAGTAAAPSTGALIGALVKEIVAVAPPGGPASVDIQFQSHTLEGLQVHIAREGEKVSVKFSTGSDAVSRLLISNLETLAQGMAHRGVDVGSITVQRTGQTSSSREDSGGSRDGGSRGRHDQGGGQKRQR